MSTTILILATAIGGILAGYLARSRTVARLRAAYADATWRADHDPLTGLPNRTTALRHLRQLATDRRPATIALLDLDSFKQVNDEHGHGAGDQLLAAVATRLHHLAGRHHGHAYRLAGDEFLLILPTTDTDAAEPVASILAALPTPVTVKTANHTRAHLRPTACAGIVTTGGHPTTATATELLRRADIALWHGKHHHSWKRWQPGMHMPPAAHRWGPRLRHQHPSPPPPHPETP